MSFYHGKKMEFDCSGDARASTDELGNCSLMVVNKEGATGLSGVPTC